MPSRDVLDNIKVGRGLSPIIQTNSDAALVTQIADTQGYDSFSFIIITAGLTDVDAVFAVTMDEGNSPTLADATAVASYDLLSGTHGTAALTAASFTFANDDSLMRIGYIGNKRYVRLTITPTGNLAGAAPLAVFTMQGHPDYRGVGMTTPQYLGP